MPRVYTFAPDARLERRGNTDYVNVVRTDGQIVSRPVRTFRGDLGSWRVTNLGKSGLRSLGNRIQNMCYKSL